MSMKYVEDKEKGLLAISLDDTLDNIFKFARCKYDGDIRCYKPDSVIPMDGYVAFPNKKIAIEKARKMRFPASHVERIGNRFGQAWGIRHDIRDTYFLAVFD